MKNVFAVAEAVRRVPGEAVRRSFGRDQTRVRSEIVAKAGDALGIRQIGVAPDVVIADGQEVRNPAVLRETIDQRDVADAELSRDAAVLNGVAALQHEADRVRRVGGCLDRPEHRFDDERMLGLELDAVVTAACVAVRDE